MNNGHLMIVDDDSAMCEALSYMFEEEGYKVSMANSCLEAREEARRTPINLGLIDIKLPDGDGVSLIKELKNISPEMAFIIITGYPSLDNAMESINENISGYYTKPLLPNDLFRIVNDTCCNQSLEKEMRGFATRYHGLVETFADVIISVNEKRKILQWNKAASRVSGYSRDEALGKPVDMLVPEKYLKRYVEAFKRFLETGKGKIVGKTVEVEMLKKGGAIIPVELSLSFFRQNSSYFFTVIIRDITERKKIEEELKKRNLELEGALGELRKAHDALVRSEKLSSLGTLAAGVAHEVLNPLNIISTIAQMMRMEDPPDDAKENLDEILAQTKRASKILNDIRMFSHLYEEGVSPIDIHRLIDSTVSLIEHDFRLEEIKVERSYGKDLPMVTGDADKLAQVFLNLLNNAKDALQGRKGNKITIATKALDKGVEIRLSDNGPGIPQDTIHKIFDPFFTTKGAEKGTGLGLSVLFTIIEEHKGGIRVESEEGKGATFVITLPTG